MDYRIITAGHVDDLQLIVQSVLDNGHYYKVTQPSVGFFSLDRSHVSSQMPTKVDDNTKYHKIELGAGWELHGGPFYSHVISQGTFHGDYHQAMTRENKK